MLKEFLERNPEYSMGQKTLSNKTTMFILYNLEKYDVVEVTGIALYLLHKKYKDELIKKYAKQYYYLIEGEIYSLDYNKLTPITGTVRPILVQQLKTKSKVIADGYEDITNFVRLLIVNGNMKGTKEHKRTDRPLLRSIKLSELGLKLKIMNLYNNKSYLTFDYCGEIDNTIEYDLPKDKMKALMRNNFVKIDKDYHTRVILPKVINNEQTIEQANEALLFEFGTRNNNSIFKIELEKVPELKGEDIC